MAKRKKCGWEFSANIEKAVELVGDKQKLAAWSGTSPATIYNWLKRPPTKIVEKSRGPLVKIAKLLGLRAPDELFEKQVRFEGFGGEHPMTTYAKDADFFTEVLREAFECGGRNVVDRLIEFLDTFGAEQFLFALRAYANLCKLEEGDKRKSLELMQHFSQFPDEPLGPSLFNLAN